MLKKTLNTITDYYLTAKGIQKYAFKKDKFNKLDIQKRINDKKIRKFLIYAKTKSPYYNQLMSHISNSEINNEMLGDIFNSIPITKKKDILDNKKDFLIARFKKFITNSTSGSAGMPLEVRLSHNAWIWEQFFVWRHFMIMGYKFRDLMLIIRSHTPKDKNDILKFDKVRNFLYVSPYHLDSLPKSVIKKINLLKPKFVRGYPSSVNSFLENYSKDINFSILGIHTSSEILQDSIRKNIEEKSNSKVFDYYGQAELSSSFFQCSNQKYHLNFESSYVNFEQSDKYTSNIVKNISTNFENYAMPIINYDTEDYLEIEKSKLEIKCECGVEYTQINGIIGRSNTFLFNASSHRVSTININTFLSKLSNFPEFQIIQKELTEIEFITQKSISKNLQHKITNFFYTQFGLGTKFLNKKFVRISTGKKPPFINNLK